MSRIPDELILLMYRGKKCRLVSKDLDRMFMVYHIKDHYIWNPQWSDFLEGIKYHLHVSNQTSVISEGVVDLWVSGEVYDLKFSSDHCNLIKLSIYGIRQSFDMNTFSTLTNLTTLELRRTHIKNGSTLCRLNIRTVKLIDMYQPEPEEDWSFVIDMNSLTSLTMICCRGHIPQISLINLTYLDVSMNDNDWSYVSRLTNLTHLDISDTHTNDISSFVDLVKLEKLFIYNLYGIDITPLTYLTQLETLGTTDVDEEAIRSRLPNLKTIC